MTLRERLGVDEEEQEAPVQEPPVSSKFRMYAIDGHGFKVNWEISADATSAQVNNLLQRQAQLSQWMSLHEYSPDDFGASARSSSPTKAAVKAATYSDSNNPACPDCGGETEYKEGKAKNGRPWKGYFCLATKDAPQNQRHTPSWVGS